MADKELSVGVAITYRNEAAGAAGELKAIGDAASQIDAEKLDLTPLSDSLTEVAGGAGEASAQLPTLNDALGAMAGRGAPARDVFQGLVAAMKGGQGAIFDSAKGIQALVGALGTGPLGAFTLVVGALSAAFYLLRDDADSANKSVNELGETADKGKRRLKELADQTLAFENAKKGLADLDSKFSETEAVIDRMEQALARLRQSESGTSILAIEQKFAPGIAQARTAGDEGSAKRLEEKRDAEIREVKEAVELADKTAAVNATQSKIQRTQEQIIDVKVGQERLEKEYLDELRAYVSALREARETNVILTGMKDDELPGVIAGLKERLKTLEISLQTPEIQAQRKDVGEAIKVVQGFADFRKQFEEETKSIKSTREQTAKSLEAYKAEVDALTVDLRTARTDMVTELRKQVDEASGRKTAAEQGLKTAGPGQVSAASDEYTEAIKHLNDLAGQLREAEGTLVSSGDDLKKATADAAEKAKGKATEAADTVKKAGDDFAGGLAASGDVVKTATEGATGAISVGVTKMSNDILGNFDRVAVLLERIGDSVINRMDAVEARVNSSAELAAKAAAIVLWPWRRSRILGDVCRSGPYTRSTRPSPLSTTAGTSNLVSSTRAWMRL
ncbi:MAG: hypothetical protein V1929_00360 [bacterium]